MTQTSRAFGTNSGGFDRRVRTERRGPDRRRLSIAVPIDRRASLDRRINSGRRITEWFAPSEGNGQPTIEILPPTGADVALQAATLPSKPLDARARRARVPRQPKQGPDFDSITFDHNRRQYVVTALEEPTGPKGESVWHWRITVDGVVEHTLRAMPHESPESLEQRAIRTLEETGAGAVRGLHFEFEGRLYHLEDRSNALSRDSLGDTAMWCITCDGVMEGSFPAPSDEQEVVLRARAIQIARRSGEYRARLNTKRQRSNRGLPPAPSRTSESRRPELPRRTAGQQAAKGPRPTRPRIKSVVKIPLPAAGHADAKTSAVPATVTPMDKLIVTSPMPSLKDAAPLRPGPVAPRISQPTPATPITHHTNSGPQRQVANTVRPSGPQPRSPQPVRTSGAQRQPSSPRISQPVPSRPTPSRPKRRGGPWKAIRGMYAVMAAIILLPVRAFRKPIGRNRGSKPVRAAQDWIDATPLRMLLPYGMGAVILLGAFPFVVSLWIAAGIGALGFLVSRKGAQAKPFHIQHHSFERHSSFAPRVQVHTRQQPRPMGDPRTVARARNTAPQRILQSTNRP